MAMRLWPIVGYALTLALVATGCSSVSQIPATGRPRTIIVHVGSTLGLTSNVSRCVTLLNEAAEARGVEITLREVSRSGSLDDVYYCIGDVRDP